MTVNHGGRRTLSVEELEELAAQGEIDTVVCAAPDPYGRLVGKRLPVDSFRTLCLEGDGIHVSGVIFAFDLELTPVDLPIANATNGYRDIRLVPDLPTLRRIPWEPRCALVICDAYQAHGDSLIDVAPRTILRRQIARLAELDLSLKLASELEFYAYTIEPDAAREAGYANLPRITDNRSDYQLIQAARDDWFLGQIRTQMPEFGVPVEAAKPEWGRGQQEITLTYCEPLEMADRHVLFKYGVKDLARRNHVTVTFMAKPDVDDVGSSCHIHVSLWDGAGAVPLGSDRKGIAPAFGSFVAAQIDHVLELGVLFAPTVNSYRRYRTNQFAGTTIALGDDNRSCAFRIVGHGPTLHLEHRVPGADANPYYAYSAVIAAGLQGIRDSRPTPPFHEGNAEEDGALEHMTGTMMASVARFAASALARESFGDEVFEHLLRSAQSEVDAFQLGPVTHWELQRYHERA